MSNAFKSGRVLFRLIMLIAVCGLLLGGGYKAHQYRKRSAAWKALGTGQEAYAARRYTDAAVNLGRYLSVNPKNTDVLLMYADAQIRRRPQTRSNVQQAVNALELILREQPTNRAAAERLLDLYTSVNAQPDAERIARTWSAAAGSDAAARSVASGRLVSILLAQQKMDEAKDHVEGWLIQSPTDTVAQRANAEVLAARKNVKQAIEVLQALVAREPADVGAAIRLAVLLATQSDADAAKKVLDEAVSRNPNSVEALLARGRFYLFGTPTPAEKSHEHAMRDFEQAEKLAEEKADTLLKLGILYSNLGLTDKAVAVLDRAEKAAPADPNVYHARLQLALDSEDSAASAALIDRVFAAALGEQRLDVLPEVAELCAMAGRILQARKAIDDLRNANSAPEILLYLEAICDLNEKDAGENRLPKAISKLQEVVRRNPKFARAQLQLGRTMARGGEVRRAIEPLEAFINLVQLDGKVASVATARLELAQLYAQLGRWDEAVQTAGKIDLRVPNVRLANTALMNLLELQAQAARKSAAQPDRERLNELKDKVKGLIEKNPEVVLLRLFQARLLGWQGKIDEAVKQVQAVTTPDAVLPASLTLIDLYAGAGRLDQAIAECRAAMGRADKSWQPALQARLADLQASNGDLAGARRILEDLAQIGSRAERSSAMLKLAQLLLRNDRPEEARAVLTQVVAEDSRNVPARVLLLGLKPVEGQKPSHQELIEQIRAVQGEESQTWRYWQAVVWLNRDDWQAYFARADGLLKKPLEDDAGWDAGTLVLGAWYEKAGRPDKAMELYQRQLRTDGSSVDVARRLAAVAARLQQWTEVERVLDRLPQDDPLVQQYRLALALQKGEIDEARKMLEKRIEENPQDYKALLQLGTLRLESNDLADAERQLKEAMRINPDAEEALIARVELHIRQQDYEQALGLCNQAIAKHATFNSYQLRSRVYEVRGELPKAADDLRAAAGLEGMAERGFLALGQLHLRHNQRDQALASWREGIQAMPRSYLLRGATAGFLLAGSDSAEREAGVALLDEVLKERPDDEVLLLLRAEHLARFKPQEAEKAYAELVRLHPGSPAVYRSMAASAVARGRAGRALELVESGLKANPQDVNLLLLRAEVLMPSSPERALASAQDAFRIQPKNEQAAILQATALVRTGRTDAAIGCLKSFMKQGGEGSQVGARLLLARLYIDTGDLKAADLLIAEIGRLAPDNPQVAVTRMLWHRAQQQWDLIAAMAADRLSKTPTDPVPVQAAARMLVFSGKPEYQQEAIRLLRRLTELHPEDAAGWFELGSAWYVLGKPEETRVAHEHGLKLAPGQMSRANDLAWIICEDLKDPKAAAEWSAKVLADNPEDAHALDTWGVIQFRLGNVEESQNALRKCLNQADAPDRTRFSAMFHLARTIVTVDPAESRRHLENLLNNKGIIRDETEGRNILLSASSRQEARALLQQLSAQTRPAS